MRNRDRIIQYLMKNPGGIDDDDLAGALRFPHRQQANARCRELEKEGLIRRVKVRGKIQNFWIDDNTHEDGQGAASTPPFSLDQIAKSKPWYWEGYVQARIVEFLVASGYSIQSVADTASKQPGKDIVAVRGDIPVWVSVKGYPEGTKKTRPTTQAGHWFKQAIFDIIDYRGSSPDAELFLGLPEYPRYQRLAERVVWLEDAARFRYIWVSEEGSSRISYWQAC